MNKNDYVIAFYLRLSQEDEGYGESESIANQRDLLSGFISSNTEFANCQVIEFADDGYSGTNFNRPAVTDMLEKVRSSEINCIIVKDFSRFGRNFIEVGDYIEQVFPFLGVRFISVNNNFDSSNHTTSTGTLDIAFNNFINDLYSKDISIKVRSAKQAKMRKGDFMSSGAIFGYQKSKDNKNRLEIDPIAAEYVRMVFTLCVDGNSTTAIASKLNAKNIPTPLAYKRGIGQGRKWNIIGEENYWTRTMVLRILRDERYTGTLVSGKRKISKVGSGRSVNVPQDEWIITPNTHDPIIPRDFFDEAQNIIGQKQKRAAKAATPRLFAGKIKCGNCGHALRGRHDKTEPYYYCETVNFTKSVCTTEKIYESLLIELLLLFTEKHAEMALCAENILTELKRKTDKSKSKVMGEINALQVDIDKAKVSKVTLYENYKDGKLTKELYLKERNQCEQNIKEMTDQLEIMKLEFNDLRSDENNNSFIESFKKYGLISELTPQLVQELVSMIRIYDSDTIEIEWNFEDDFHRVMELIETSLAVS